MPSDTINTSRRKALKLLGTSTLLALPAVMASPRPHAMSAEKRAHNQIDYRGTHQSGVITPEPKEAIFIALNLTITTPDKLIILLKKLTQRIAILTQSKTPPKNSNDKLPPHGSGILGATLIPDSLTITLSVGASLFDSRFGLHTRKPRYLTAMTPFPNDALEKAWCGGDLLLQLCANTKESVIYALRDILRHTSPYLYPIWKIEGFLPSRDIDKKTTPINLFGFKDGTGNAPSNDTTLMDKLVWVTAEQKEPQWSLGGSYQAIRLIRFNVEFWDRTPLEDQENDFGRHKVSGAPIGMKHEMDDPHFDKDPHGDRILFDSHMRRAEPRTTSRHTATLRRRSYSYSLGLTSAGQLDMGLIFVSYQNNLKTGFIDTQKRLNGEPLERYIKPFGGGYYFVLPGVKSDHNYLGETLMAEISPS